MRYLPSHVAAIPLPVGAAGPTVQLAAHTKVERQRDRLRCSRLAVRLEREAPEEWAGGHREVGGVVGHHDVIDDLFAR